MYAGADDRASQHPRIGETNPGKVAEQVGTHSNVDRRREYRGLYKNNGKKMETTI